jgi:hypothetical protein
MAELFFQGRFPAFIQDNPGSEALSAGKFAAVNF